MNYVRLSPRPVTAPHQCRARNLLQTSRRWSDADVIFLRAMVCAPVLSAPEKSRLDALAVQHG